jgi:plastocyanin
MTQSRSPRLASSAAGIRSATGFARAVRAYANPVTVTVVLCCGLAAPCTAGELSVTVVDRAGRGVGDVVVTATPADRGTAPARRAAATAVMDQRNRAFVPQVLVVAVGSSVEFPNNDTVSHQVYSFSAAKKFQLPLYKGVHHAPVTFDAEGLVVLGCNIHDEMAGYVYVTAAPDFGTTSDDGTLRLQDLAPGDYRITIWSPLVADPPSTLERVVHVAAQDPAVSRIQLSRGLRARPEPRPRRGDWEY